MNLIDVMQQFGTEEACVNFLESIRWPDGVRCLKCQGSKVSRIQTNPTERKTKNRKTGQVVTKLVPARIVYQCLNPKCNHQFSATANTVFHDTHLPIEKWFMAVALMIHAKKGLSAKQIERDLGVSYKTAWYLAHRIREAMMDSAPEIFEGIVEADATFVGGKYDRRRQRAKYGKQAVFGLVQRGGSFHQVSVKHLSRYLAEFTYRFNNREEEDLFTLVIAALLIKAALPYANLTAKAETTLDEEPF